MKRLLLILASMISFCFADDSVPHLYILHINGINTEWQEARDNARALEKATNFKSNMMTFSYVYNPTKGGDKNPGLWTNLMDVAKQKMLEGKDTMTLDDFTRAWLMNEGKDPDRMTPQEYAAAKADIEKDYENAKNGEFGNNSDDIINNFHGIVPVEFKSVVDLVNTPYVPHPLAATYQITDSKSYSPTESQLKAFTSLRQYIQQNPLEQHEVWDYSKTRNLVLLVPHSQGNLYANDLYTYLIKKENFPEYQLAVYGIASPADHINGDWVAKKLQDLAKQEPGFANVALPLDSYITSIHDFVINSARTIFYSNPAMPGNINIPWTTSLVGHNLIDAYLNDEVSRAQISKMIVFEADYLASSIFDSANNIEKFGLSMMSPVYPDSGGATGITMSNQDKLVCNGESCAYNVLYVSTYYSVFNQRSIYFYFPHKDFANNSYKILQDRYGGIAWVFFSKSTNYKQSDVDNYDSHYYCNSYIKNDVKIPAITYDVLGKHWNDLMITCPSYFYNGKFIMSEFSVN